MQHFSFTDRPSQTTKVVPVSNSCVYTSNQKLEWISTWTQASGCSQSRNVSHIAHNLLGQPHLDSWYGKMRLILKRTNVIDSAFLEHLNHICIFRYDTVVYSWHRLCCHSNQSVDTRKVRFYRDTYVIFGAWFVFRTVNLTTFSASYYVVRAYYIHLIISGEVDGW